MSALDTIEQVKCGLIDDDIILELVKQNLELTSKLESANLSIQIARLLSSVHDKVFHTEISKEIHRVLS